MYHRNTGSSPDSKFQYGGQSITLSHLVPFVGNQPSAKYRRDVRAEFEVEGMELDEQKINEIAEMRVRKEVKQGVQVIQYQVITLMTTNGQLPFCYRIYVS